MKNSVCNRYRSAIDQIRLKNNFSHPNNRLFLNRRESVGNRKGQDFGTVLKKYCASL